MSNNKKTFIHSLWTKPMFNNLRDMGDLNIINNLYLYTISAWYVKKWGGYIKFYGDEFALSMMEFAPYDEKILAFESIDEKECPCWAFPKIITLDDNEVPFTHIDGDVLIKSQRMFNEITDDSFDLITESRMSNTEDNSYFMDWHKDYFENFTDIVDEFDFNATCFNGCMTFNNEELKNKFIQKYIEYRDNLFLSEERYYMSNKFKEFVPDIVIEQMNLYQISKKYKTKGVVNHLINDYDSNQETIYEIFKEKYNNEYRHYAGKEKCEISVEHFRNMLKQLDTELYQKTREKESELRKYLLIEDEI